MNNINEFNVGGTHQSNPLGGIPIGVNPQTGQEQTVEQGETMTNIKGSDFIFSKKYKLSKTDIKKYNLPENLSGLSMANATKKINDLYSERADAISSKTKTEFLERIAEAQESQKLAEETEVYNAMQMNNQQDFIDYSGMEPQEPLDLSKPVESEQFNEGGFTDTAQKTSQGFNAGGTNYGGIATGTLGLIDQARGNTSPKAGVSTLTGAAAGASVGTMIFPGIGTAIGAGVGAIAGAIGGNIAKKKAERRLTKEADKANAVYMDKQSFADGGFREPLTSISGTPASYMYRDNSPVGSAAITPMYSPSTTKTTNRNTRGVDANNLMRLAPILNNFNQLNSQTEPTYKQPVYNTSQATRRYADVNAMVNPINTQANNSIAALNQMGGSTGSRRAAILASNLMRQRAVGEAYLNASNINRQVDDRADMIDYQTNESNLARTAQAYENYDRDLGAYLTNRSQLQNTMYNSIGNIGLENRNEETVQRMFGYDSQGRYVQGGSNSTYTPDSSIQDTVNSYKTKNTKSSKTENSTPSTSTYKASPYRSASQIISEVEEANKETPKKKATVKPKSTSSSRGKQTVPSTKEVGNLINMATFSNPNLQKPKSKKNQEPFQFYTSPRLLNTNYGK